MKKLKYLTSFLLLSLAMAGFAQQPFTPGNMVVCRVGNGTTILGGSTLGSPVFLDEYTSTGTLVQSIPMPTAVNGSNNILTINAPDFLMGNINLSADGRYIVVAGFNLPVDSTSGQTAGVIGLVDYNGNVNTSTAVPYPESSHKINTAVSTDGNSIWYTGYDVVNYTTVGSNTGTAITGPIGAQFGNLNITNGQLYSSIGKSPTDVYTVGTGLPTIPGQALNVLPGFAIDYTVQQYAFADLDPNTPGVDVLYVASQQGTTLGGIKKFSLVEGSWMLNGSVSTGSTSATRYQGLTLTVTGNTVNLYFTGRGTNATTVRGGQLLTLSDASGYNGAFSGTPTVIADVATRFGAPNVASFRGVALVPQAPSVKLSIKAYLQGAFNNTLGRHKDVTTTWASVLNANALSQPYNAAPFNYAGAESVSSGFFTSNAGSNTDIVDWVLLELRDATTPTTVIARKAAFIREDGQIVDVDGSSPVTFTASPNGVSAGNYYVVVRHRNHLSVRSANAIALSSTSTSYDFTAGQSQAFQNGAISNTPMATQDLLGTTTGVTMLWGGNANGDGLVRASAGANVNDYLTLMSPANLNGNTSTILSNVYRGVDMNLDGTVRASAGANVNDYLTLMSPGILNGNTSNILTAH